MDRRKFRDVSVRYLIATAGLLLVAMGVAFSILSNLGTSPLSCPAYVLTGTWGLTVGNWTIIINMFYLLVQIAIMRKGFKSKYLMQIAATVVFGYLIDFSLWCFSWVHPMTIAGRLGLCLLSCAVTALGVSIEVVAQAWMLSAEMTVYAVVKTFGKPFGPVKVAMDTILVFVSAGIAALMFGNPFGYGRFEGLLGVLTGGSEGVVIGSGTLIMALLTGYLMKFSDPVVDRMMDWVLSKMISRNV